MIKALFSSVFPIFGVICVLHILLSTGGTLLNKTSMIPVFMEHIKKWERQKLNDFKDSKCYKKGSACHVQSGMASGFHLVCNGWLKASVG